MCLSMSLEVEIGSASAAIARSSRKWADPRSSARVAYIGRKSPTSSRLVSEQKKSTPSPSFLRYDI